MICIGPLVFHLPGRASSPARRGGSEHRNVEGGRRGQESSAHDVAGEEGEGPTTRAALSQVRRTRPEGGGGGQIAENELQRRSGGYISRGEAKPASQQGLDVLPSLPAPRSGDGPSLRIAKLPSPLRSSTFCATCRRGSF